VLRRRPLVALTVVALLAGCSDDDASPPASSSTSTTPASTTSVTTSTSTTSTSTSPTTSSTTVPTPPPATIADLLALKRPIVLAHTGGEDEFPGSTLFAFGESMKAGVDMLDLNVQLTGDGVVIIHHDDTVDRTTNGTGNVIHMDLATVQALDDAYWFTSGCTCKNRPDADYVYRGIRTGERPPPPGYGADDFAVPTLRTLVERYPDVPLNVEIEGDGERGAATAAATVTLLTELDRMDATVFSAFDDGVVAVLEQLAPTAEISPGLNASAEWVLNRTPLPSGQRILQLPPTYEGLDVLTPEVVERSHAAGYLIWVWPDDSALENQQAYLDFLNQGMDGLNINFPAQGVAALHDFLQQD
jgi:glycerophosphoryl diester phosphodiesterase